MQEFNNCNEVLDFLVNNIGSSFDDELIKFEGVDALITEDTPEDGVFAINPKYKGFLFLIGEEEFDGKFPIFAYKNGESFEGKVAVLLPSVYRNEMIATAMGEW